MSIAALFIIAKESMDRWLNKQNLAYTCDRILFNLKKERNYDMLQHQGTVKTLW